MYEIVVENFERFQAAILGLLGFAGVILTIQKNAQLARQQHQQQLAHERSSLRTALCAELKMIRDTYEERISTLRKGGPGESGLIPSGVQNAVYGQLLDRIGLLSLEEVAAVMKAYVLAAELPVRLRLLELNLSGLKEEVPGYIRVSAAYTDSVATMHENFLKDVTAALLSVEAKLD